MTRDAVRRLRSAKRAARECLARGGSAEEAASAAQAFGTPCGDDSDASDDSEQGEAEEEEEEEDESQEATLSAAIEGQLRVADSGGAVAPPAVPSAAGAASAPGTGGDSVEALPELT